MERLPGIFLQGVQIMHMLAAISQVQAVKIQKENKLKDQRKSGI
jgi:hypothetical protein